MNFSGLLVGLATFLIIGLFHPIVIKSEYHFGVRCWWVFLLVGIAFAIAYGTNYFEITGSYWISKTGGSPAYSNWQYIPVHESQLENPGVSVLFLDSYNYTTPTIGISSVYPYKRTDSGTAHASHNNVCNVTWCDGSARPITTKGEFGCYDVLGELKGRSNIGDGNYWDRTAIRKGSL